MGYYINPPGQGKETWLWENRTGDIATSAPSYAELDKDHHFVVLVNNGAFTAAGIAYDEEEFNDFSRNDGREKAWVQVADERLINVCPSVKGALK